MALCVVVAGGGGRTRIHDPPEKVGTDFTD